MCWEGLSAEDHGRMQGACTSPGEGGEGGVTDGQPGLPQPASSGGACSTPQQEASEQGSPVDNVVICSGAAST